MCIRDSNTIINIFQKLIVKLWIKGFITNLPVSYTHLDVYKRQTMHVLRKAAAWNINFIITHESIFFGSGNTEEMLANNAVATEKKQFADGHGLVVWRDHDPVSYTHLDVYKRQDHG